MCLVFLCGGVLVVSFVVLRVCIMSHTHTQRVEMAKHRERDGERQKERDRESRIVTRTQDANGIALGDSLSLSLTHTHTLSLSLTHARTHRMETAHGHRPWRPPAARGQVRGPGVEASRFGCWHTVRG